MTPENILEVVALYRARFETQKVPKKQMDSSKALAYFPMPERLAHAHYLLDGIVESTQTPGGESEANRHLGHVQIILSFAGWYTLDQLKAHNRPNV